MRVPSTTEAAAERLTEPVDQIGESPVWRGGEGALYWVDIGGKSVNRLELASGNRTSWKAEEMPACLAFARDGALLAGMETGIFSLELAGGVARGRRLASVNHPMASMRFNDGRCDRQGRLWAGTLHTNIPAGNAVGALYRYDPDGSLTGPLESGLLVQNGLAWSPDGRRMYLADSHVSVNKVWVFDYDIDAGLPRNRRVFVDMAALGIGRPDGAAMDAEGCYWVCANDGGAVLRFTPEGRLDRRVPVPTPKPTMCAFGGKRLDTLFVTSMKPRDAEQLKQQPLAGAVFALSPGVQGLAEPEFGN